MKQQFLQKNIMMRCVLLLLAIFLSLSFTNLFAQKNNTSKNKKPKSSLDIEMEKARQLLKKTASSNPAPTNSTPLPTNNSNALPINNALPNTMQNNMNAQPYNNQANANEAVPVVQQQYNQMPPQDQQYYTPQNMPVQNNSHSSYSSQPLPAFTLLNITPEEVVWMKSRGFLYGYYTGRFENVNENLRIAFKSKRLEKSLFMYGLIGIGAGILSSTLAARSYSSLDVTNTIFFNTLSILLFLGSGTCIRVSSFMHRKANTYLDASVNEEKYLYNLNH